MQISVVSLCLIWSLISSSMNQITNTAPSFKSKNCIYCGNKYYSINRPLENEYYTSCNDTVKCDKQEDLCGIKINKPANMKYMQLSLGCINNKDCNTKKILPITKMTFFEEVNAVECCNGTLCNKKANLPITRLVLSRKKKDEYNKKCTGFSDNHQEIYLSDKSDNIQKIKQNDNLIIAYKDIDIDYIKRHAISTTWYVVFPDKEPYKQEKIASFSKNKQGEFIVSTINRDLIKQEKIFYFTHEFMNLCKFNLKGLNTILNKIVTTNGDTRLFGVVLTDKDVTPPVKGIIDRIKNLNVTTKMYQINTSNVNNQNNMAKRSILSNIIMLIPLISVANFN